MTCEQALEAMSAALDGELSAEERKELDEHLNTCPKCAALMKELSGQSLLLRQLDCDVPTGLDARILSALPEQPRPAKKGKIIHWRRWGTLAACLILALWGGSALTNGLRMGADAALNNMAAPPMMDAVPGDTGEAPDDSCAAGGSGAETDRGGGSADPGEEAGNSVGGQDAFIGSSAATKYGAEPIVPMLESDALYLRANTEKGAALLAGLPLEEGEESAVAAAQERTRSILNRLPLRELTTEGFGREEAMLELFHRPEWDQLSESCLGCGACTFACPTCQCYDIKEFTGNREILRYRCWDSCMYSDFTIMSAGQPRPTQKERFRQRFLHKLQYFPVNQGGIFGCVGCGRCLRQCPIHMNIVKVMKTLGGAPHES